MLVDLSALYAATLRVASTSRSASWESSERLKLSERRSSSSKVAEGSMGSAQRIHAQPPWRVGGECRAGGGVMESGEPLRIESALMLEVGELLRGLRLELAELWSN